MQQTQPGLEWHAQRRHLSHDWLKNRLIVEVGAALNLARGDFKDPEFEARFFQDILPEWESKRIEVEKWGRETETALSPRAWLAHQPLDALPEATLLWLGDAVHELWLRDVPVKAWAQDLECAIRGADERYCVVKELVPPAVVYGRKEFGHALWDFGVACERLATVLSSFPTKASPA